MKLTRWDPFRELEDMSNRLNRIFGSRPAARPESGREDVSVPDWAPTVDITESAEEYLIKVELPEVKKEEIKIRAQDGVLTIEGERRRESEEKGKKFHRVERSYGMFARSFTLPDSVEEEKIEADFKDGMLNLHLPKSETTKAKAVEVAVK
jgi:HSP20 family protein